LSYIYWCKKINDLQNCIWGWGRGGVNGIGLAQDGNKWRAVVSNVINIQVLQTARAHVHRNGSWTLRPLHRPLRYLENARRRLPGDSTSYFRDNEPTTSQLLKPQNSRGKS